MERVRMNERTGAGFYRRCAELAGVGCSPLDVAQGLGMKYPRVYSWYNGRSEPSYQAICAILDQHPEADARWLLLGEEADDGE